MQILSGPGYLEDSHILGIEAIAYAFHAPIILFVIAIFGNRSTYSSWVPWMAILASLCAMQVLFYYIELPTHKFERRLNYPGG